MTSARHMRASDLFVAALNRPIEERREYIEVACAGDVELRNHVLALLQHDENPKLMLEVPCVLMEVEHKLLDPQLSATKKGHEPAPENIGPFRILSCLGEGGMGVVYLAEQHKPIHRRVALKLVKLGMDTKQVLARFEIERQALALMNHPNVAKVFEAGATERGRPYFVMEHVAGIPITEYCDKQRLTTEERVRLFMDVCHAVQHAHQKGIIHRDIKPSNVLVAVQDDKPVVKVIDFGVAKATEHRLTERTLFTEQGQLIGTPGYMSPEQAEMSALDIDTRTDIYSLGVLLYELLTGELPFDNKELLRAGWVEIQRIIREIDPPKPSTKFTSLGASSTAAAHNRRTEVGTLARLLRRDLDWIVMKCLEKDRIRRYDTADGLAMELQRYLNNEPILGGRPSALYRLRKTLRRHRGFVAATLAIMIVAALGASGVGWSYWLASREKDRRLASERERWLIEAIRATEQKHWDGAENAFLQAVKIDSNHARTLIEHGRMKWQQSKDQGNLSNTSLLDDAERLFRKGLEIEPENWNGWNNLGIVLKIKMRYSEARSAYEKSANLRSDHFASWVNLGTISALDHDLVAAEKHLIKATELAASVTNEQLLKYAAEAWRNLASLQLYRGEPFAFDNIERAIAMNPEEDVGANLIRARLRLLPSRQDAAGAYQDALYADRLAHGSLLSGKAKRILALAAFAAGRVDEAQVNANAAIEQQDLPAINHLIMAVIAAKGQDVEQARAYLAQAESEWPGELRNSGDYRAEAPDGVLWFDTADELYQLREEAGHTLDTSSP